MKKLLCATLTLVASASLASCGETPASSDEFKPALDTKTACTIKVVGDYSNFEALDTYELAHFKEYYPNVEIDYRKLDSYEDSIANRLESDKTEIFCSFPKMLTDSKFAKVVAHMEDLSDPKLNLNINSIRSNLLNRDPQGKVYMVPVFSRTYGALINEDLFAKEGVKIPTTLAEFTSACEAFRAKNYASPLMGYTKADVKKGVSKPSNGLMYAVAYPLFMAELAKNPEALQLANNLDSRAGEYTRTALQKVKDLFDKGIVNREECDKIGDNYEKTLLRFFEGNVPMMACSGDTVSGAKKREGKSAAYGQNPFKYSFYPLPLTEDGGYFIDSPSLEFSVNKDSENLAMANEFMRFLVTTKELDYMASVKGLISPTQTKPFPSIYYKDGDDKETYTPIYTPFGNVPAERTISPEVIGVKDALTSQIKAASFYVGRGEMTVDEAVAKYGTFA